MKEQIEKMKCDLEQCHREFVNDGDVYTDYEGTAKGLIEKGWRKIVTCKDCVNRNTPDCAMWYQCDVCGGQWSWNNECGFCSFGERKE